MKRIFLILLVTLSLQSCFGNDEDKYKLQPGQCFTNMECGEGTKCVDGWCHDLYFPDAKIKPL